MIPSVLSSQLIQGTKDFLSTTFPSSTPTFFDMMDTFINEEGKLTKEKSLVFVAATRAKKSLLVSYYGEKSEFLEL